MENNPAFRIPDDDLRRYAELIFGTSKKMGAIINDLLLLAKIRRQEEVPLSRLEMGQVVSEALRQLGWQIENVEADIRYPNKWPEVVGHGPWVEVIWVNYISNALKYGGE